MFPIHERHKLEQGGGTLEIHSSKRLDSWDRSLDSSQPLKDGLCDYLFLWHSELFFWFNIIFDFTYPHDKPLVSPAPR